MRMTSDNDAYTNAAAKENLRLATTAASLLEKARRTLIGQTDCGRTSPLRGFLMA